MQMTSPVGPPGDWTATKSPHYLKDKTGNKCYKALLFLVLSTVEYKNKDLLEKRKVT
jgi:hypothetical protein